MTTPSQLASYDLSLADGTFERDLDKVVALIKRNGYITNWRLHQLAVRENKHPEGYRSSLTRLKNAGVATIDGVEQNPLSKRGNARYVLTGVPYDYREVMKIDAWQRKNKTYTCPDCGKTHPITKDNTNKPTAEAAREALGLWAEQTTSDTTGK